MENNKEELAQKGLKILQKEFLVIGKTHVKSWQAWLALGLIAGVSASIFFVANNRARFFKAVPGFSQVMFSCGRERRLTN